MSTMPQGLKQKAALAGRQRDARINQITQEKIAAKQRDQALAQKTQRDAMLQQGLNRQHEMARTQLMEGGQNRRLGAELGFRGQESALSRTHDTGLQDSRLASERERLVMGNMHATSLQDIRLKSEHEHARTMDDRRQDSDYVAANRKLAGDALMAGADPQAAHNLYNNTHQGRAPDLSGLKVPQKGEADKYSAIPSKVDSSVYRMNQRTGEMEQVFDQDGKRSGGGGEGQGAIYQPDPQQLAESQAMVNTGTPDQARQWMATLAKSNPQLYNYMIQQEQAKEALLQQ